MFVVLALVSYASCQDNPPKKKIPEICGLKPILEAKCSPDKNLEECTQCILGVLMSGCHELKPEPGKSDDCGKILGCINSQEFKC